MRFFSIYIIILLWGRIVVENSGRMTKYTGDNSKNKNIKGFLLFLVEKK